MGFLSDTVTKSQRRWQGVYVPEWMPAARWAAGGLAALFLGVSLLTSVAREPEAADAAGTGTGTGTGMAVASDSVSADQPAEPAADRPAAEPAAGGVQELPSYSGDGTVQVPDAAVRLAEQAVAALFTGDFTAVPLVDGAETPVAARVWKDARVKGATAATVDQGSATVLVRVDPDGSGELGPREVPAIVVLQDGKWAYLPG